MGHKRQESNRRIVEADQDHLSFVFDTLKDAIFTVDAEEDGTFRFVSANQQFLENMGLRRQDVIGATVDEIIPEESVDFVKSKYAESIEKDENLRWEETIRLSTGIKTGIVSITPVYNESRECLQLIGSISDITERKAVEDELRKVMNQSLDVICTIDGQGLFVKVSDASERLWQYTPEELQGTPFMELVHPDDQNSTAEIAEQIMNGLETTSFENRYIRKDGSEIPMIWSARWDDEDELMYCVGKDAGELKEAERQLNLREERFRKLVQEGADMIAILSSEGNYRYVSPSHKHLMGYEQDELIGKDAIEIAIHPEDKEKIEEYFNTLSQEKKITTSVYRARTKSGDVVRLKSTATNLLDDPAVRGIVVNSSDVTESYYFNNLDKLERKVLQDNVAGKELKKLLTNYVLGIEELHEGVICSIMSIDEEKLYNLASPNLPDGFKQQIEGLKIGRDEGSCGTAAFLGEKIIVSDIQSDSRWEKYRDLAEQFGFSSCWSYPVFNTENRVVATFAVYHSKCKKPSEFEENTLERGAQLVQTILENQHMLKALHESNERYELATQATSDAIWEYNPATDTYMMGEGFTSLFGYERESGSYGMKYWMENVHPDDRPKLQSKVEEMLTGTENRLEQEYRLKKANGRYAYVRDKAIVVRDTEGRPERVVGAMQDITRKKQEELQLKLMESVVTNTRDSILITRAEPMDAPDGPEILYVNDSFEKMTGYSAGEVIGKTPRILQGPNTDFEAMKDVGEKIRRWEPATAETINYKKNGEEFWINFSVTPVADETGWYTHWIAVERDVTERKNRELKQALLSDIGQVFNKSGGVTDALENTLSNIQEFGDFELLEYWKVNRDSNSIDRTATISDRDFRAFYAYDDNKVSFEFGEGLPGRAWKTGKRQFWKNLHKRTSFIRRDAAKKVGLRTGYGLPVYFNGEVTGVIVAAVTETRDREHYFAPILDDVARQLGQEIHRKELEEELARIFSSAPDVICVAGLDGYYKKVNPAMTDLLGYSEDKLLETPIIDFVHPDDKEKTRREFEALNEGEGQQYFENRHITKSGKVIWLSWTTKPFYDEKVTYSIAKNITEQKELEELLNQANRLAKIGSWEVDLIENTIYWSDMTRKIHEEEPDFEPDLEAGINYYKEGESRERIKAAVDDAVQNGSSWDLELPIITAKGNERWIRTIGEAQLVDGKCVRIYGSFQDIHERKELEELFTQATKMAKIGSWEVDFQKNSVYWSDITKSIYGVEPDYEPIVEKRIQFYKRGESRDQMREAVQQAKENGTPWDIEVQIVTPSGQEKWIRSIGKAERMLDGEYTRLYGSFQDINERKGLEELAQMTTRLAKIGSWELNLRDNREKMYWSEMTRQILEVDEEYNPTLTGGFEFYTPESRVEIEEAVEKTLETGEPFDLELLIETAQGRKKWIRCIGNGEMEEGRCVRMYGSYQDIDKRKRAELAYRTVARERVKILESISDAFYAVDRDWNFTYFNREAGTLLDKNAPDVVGKNLWSEFPAAAETELYDKYHRVMEEQEPESFEYFYPPQESWYDISAYPASDGISVYFKNIDERKRYQQQILNKTRQLDSIAKFNGLLIKEAEWITALEHCLDDFGEAAAADRVYFFEVDEDYPNGEPTASMRIEWVREGISPQIDNPDHHALPLSDIDSFIQELKRENLYNYRVEEIGDQQFRTFLQQQNIESLLALPVITGSQFRGFIGFDDCTSQKRWNKEEIVFLETIVFNLSSAIENEDAEIALQSAFEEKTEILESIGDAFFTVDGDWTVTYWNNMAEQMLGMERDEILGKNLWEVYDDAVELEFYRQYHKAVEEQTTVEFEEYYPTLDKWFEVSAYPSPNGLSVFFKDVTDRKRSERELKKLNKRLERKARELAASNAELEQFAFVASHDLQEPLRMITGFLARLEKKYEPLLDEKGKKYIHFATDGARRMRQIILDLLEFSRVGRMEDRLETVDLNEVVDEVLSLNKKQIEEDQAIVDVDTLPQVTAAKGAMRQLFLNLVNNALKYHKKGRKPNVAIRVRDTGAHWEISVSDNGIGIHPDYSDKIFSIFQRLHSKEEYEGSGMGLAICKKIVETHGGRIGVESTINEGSRFYFTIPKNLQLSGE
ncbi:MAG: PAS domain S-box protein [Bacteroidetes bacterium]|jgi:PAS domain S-box-containing protein|nr:PAS domain S-box protein [Bacteroidota bacterium]